MVEKTFKKRLSETKFMEDLDFQKPFKISVDAPTSSGKTHYVINYLKQQNIPFVFLVDTLLLMKQISEDYKVSKYSSEFKDNYNDSQLVSVYNHIESLYKDKVVVIDEAHSLVTDYGFKTSVIENLLTFAGEARQVILLSGTPVISKDEFYKNIEIIKCTCDSPKQYNIDTIITKDSDDKIDNVISLAKAMKDNGKIPVISLLDTRDKLNQLCDLLTGNGFTNIALINSIVKDGELDLDSTHYEELVKSGNLDADAVITTYVQGYNINNLNCGLIIFPAKNKHSYISLAQMVARFRNIEELEIQMVLTEPKIKTEEIVTKFWDNFDKMYQKLSENSYKTVTDFINATKSQYSTNRAIRKYLSVDSKLSHLINTNLEVDSQKLALSVLNQITNLMYTNIQTANIILKQYNINLILNKTVNKNNNIMERTQNIAINNKIAVITFFNNLEVGRIPQTTMNLKVNSVYDDLRKYYLLNIEIKEILLEHFGNKQAIERVKLSLDFRFSNDTTIKKIRQQILTAFKLKQWYSSAEIKDKMQVILTDNNSTVSLNRAAEIFKFLFQIEEKVKRIDDKIIRGYNIISAK
jgi:hypothetical protein